MSGRFGLAIVAAVCMLFLSSTVHAQSIPQPSITLSATTSTAIMTGQNVTFANSTTSGTPPYITYTYSVTDSNGTDALGSGKASLGTGNQIIFAIPGTYQVSENVTDSANAIGTSSKVTITVSAGTTPPTISGTPSNYVDPVSAATSAGSIETYTTPTAVDEYSASVVVSCSPASGSTFPIGTTKVTCTATDAYQNIASTTFTITVNAGTTLPTITGTPSDIAGINATSASGAVVDYTAPIAFNQYSRPIEVNCTPAPGATFAIGLTTVTCKTTDAYNNTASVNFTVTVDAGKTLPTITGTPSDIAGINATSASGAVVDYTPPTATDQYGTALTPSCAQASGSTFAIGTTNVTCTATDAYGNAASTNFTVTVSQQKVTTSTSVTSSVTSTANTITSPVVNATSVTTTPASPSAGNLLPLLGTGIAIATAFAAGVAYSRISEARKRRW